MNEKSMIRDLTQGSVTRLLLIFSFPLLLSNLLQTVYNMVDMVVIGQFVGKTGLSAVSIGGDVMHLTLFLAMGFANAGQVLLSQYIGAGNHKRVRGTIGTMFTLILGAALVLTVFGVFFLNTFLHLMNTPQECYKETGAQAVSYTTGVPAMIGTAMVASGTWAEKGVFNVEEFDPDPYMDMLNKYGLPWVVDENPVTVE